MLRSSFGFDITYASENPTVEQRNGRGTEKSEECSRRMQKKNEKQPAAGDDKIDLHVY